MHAPAPLPPAVRTAVPYCAVGAGELAGARGRGTGDEDASGGRGRACAGGGQRRGWGEGGGAGNSEDLDQATLLVLVGSNTAWCHPVLFQRMTRNRRDRGAKIVVIDPRRTV